MKTEHLSKEEINQLPLFRITCEIIVITNTEQCEKAIAELSLEKELGFDTESKPVFVKGQQNDVSLIQLSTRTKVYLFRINKIGFTKSIIKLLENENIIKTGVAVQGDINELNRLKSFSPNGFIELADMAKQFKFKNHGLRYLCARLFAYRVSKGAKLSNWENEKLTNSQIKYAATDAWIGLQIYDKFEHMKKQKNL